MNKSLLLFSIIIILAGLAFGVSLLILLGAILLVPALVSRPKPPTQSQTKPAPSRAPKPVPQAAASSQVAQPWQSQVPATQNLPSLDMIVSRESQAGYGVNAALFPLPMFPTMGQGSTMPAASNEKKPEGARDRDELLELVLIMALLRTAS
ncbi:MAG TPA: hypothetical protein VEJ36_01955 [Nitrososphaerales archaeon]|nr:hypothetical protein [Nitrososphaerales archaeon]